MRLPACAGIGVRAPHYQDVLAYSGRPGWYEVHSENFFAEGGPALRLLDQLADRAPLSFHGVGLGLGSANALDQDHLAALARLVERYRPAMVSEHLCWGHSGDWHSNELLPMPYTPEAVSHLAQRIDAVQQVLGRRILVENVSCYLRFAGDTLSEWEFVAAVCAEADCGLLLDLNNVYVNACNQGYDTSDFLAGVPWSRVAEMHLAGHRSAPWGLLDSHDAAVAPAVWALFQDAIARCGPVATLVEWDRDLPSFERLLAEVARAQQVIDHATIIAG